MRRQGMRAASRRENAGSSTQMPQAPPRRGAYDRLLARNDNLSSRTPLLSLLSQPPHCVFQGFRRWGEFRAFAFQQRHAVLATLAAIVDRKLRCVLGRATPETDAGVLPVLAQDVVRHADVLELIHVVVVIAGDPLQRVKTGFLR